MKIGDQVKLCNLSNIEELDAYIFGEEEDGRSASKWLVNCPEKQIVNAVFYKDEESGRCYEYAGRQYFIVKA